ncbi:DUF2306 domain-containing protein [Parasalinivibrio latis]|uniref:DUF2306 domain-containing protein n=1 Tax=Parasalinivibrio latis TaxID=2952610 RepID=UPI0030E15E86
MTYTALMYLHLGTVLPAFFIGGWMMVGRKGSGKHRFLGLTYMVLMLVTALVSLGMEARVGPQFLGHFGFIHLLSVLTVYAVFEGLLAVRRGNIHKHRKNMMQLYIGACLVAGGLALMPGRFLHSVLFS